MYIYACDPLLFLSFFLLFLAHEMIFRPPVEIFYRERKTKTRKQDRETGEPVGRENSSFYDISVSEQRASCHIYVLQFGIKTLLCVERCCSDCTIVSKIRGCFSSLSLPLTPVSHTYRGMGEKRKRKRKKKETHKEILIVIYMYISLFGPPEPINGHTHTHTTHTHTLSCRHRHPSRAFLSRHDDVPFHPVRWQLARPWADVNTLRDRFARSFEWRRTIYLITQWGHFCVSIRVITYGQISLRLRRHF